MDYQAKYKKKIKGFTLVELVVVIGIFLIIFGVSDSVYNSYKVKNSLEVSVESIVQSIRHAQVNSEQVQGDSKWGVSFFSDKIVVFKGQDYASRIASSDQIFNLPKGVSVSGLSEIIFDKTTGFTNNTGTTTVISSNNEAKYIYINEKGTVIY